MQVLNGPQGTLFGKNTTGGVVLFSPNRPSNRWEGSLKGEVGNYDMRSIEAMLNVPLSDSLQIRLAGQAQRRDGFTIDRGPFFPGKDYDDRRFWAVRGSVLLQLTPDLENYTIVDSLGSNTNGQGYIFDLLNPAYVSAGMWTNYFHQQQAAGVRSTAYSANSHDDRFNFGVINTTRWHISPSLAVKNIFSYRIVKWENGQDNDASPFVMTDLVGARPNLGRWHLQTGTLTDELQMQGSILNGDLEFTTGAYLETTKALGPQPYEVHCCENFGEFVFIQPDSTNDSRSRGVYGQATYDLGNALSPLRGLKLTAGYRRSWDKYEYVRRQGEVRKLDESNIASAQISQA